MKADAESDQDSATFWFVWPGHEPVLFVTEISSSVQWGRCDVSLASCKNVRTNAPNNAWPEAARGKTLHTIKARKEHVGSAPCGTEEGHCHLGGPAALIVAAVWGS